MRSPDLKYCFSNFLLKWPGFCRPANVKTVALLSLVLLLDVGCSSTCRRHKIAKLAPPEPQRQVASKGPVLPPPRPRVAVQFDSKIVTFELAKSILKPKSKTFLTKVSQILNDQADNWGSILVGGHTDATGNQESNQELSNLRAKSVIDHLISQGIPESRLTAKGFGSTKLLPGESPKSGKNRRVEFEFEGVQDGEKLNLALEQLKNLDSQ